VNEGIYRPRYRDKKTREWRQSSIWWIRYTHQGKKYRENSKSEIRANAVAMRKRRMGQAESGKPVNTAIRRTTLKDLAELVYAVYRNNGYRSLARQEDAFNHLADYFGWDCPAVAITKTRLLQDYLPWRRNQPNKLFTKHPHSGCAVATANRELTAVRRAFRLAADSDPPLVAALLCIKLPKERNRRKGFLEWSEFAAIREHLPGHLKPVMTTAYYTGWRVPSEICSRERRHIRDGMLVLEVYEGKNEEPRLFPLDMVPDLRDTIEQQLEATRKLEAGTGRVISLLFHNRGNRIVDYRSAWKDACKAAGLSGKIPHDFRRTAARNLIQSGVDPFTTCQLVGWKSMEMLKRYNIVDEQTLKRAVVKLVAHIEEQKRRPAKVAAIR
jgi:integrase